ncbi:MAG: TetR family transcriptional regulator [Rhodospirillaceae bacterium]|uniref:TetR/AcrR family transcriptional regulator n=1 Tax=unclassified Hwanghaeella TaxID=2605944 RepID=UPI000C6A901A|nr:TetR family transcriptional regulator [Rhodospirillales bacterium]MAX46864.1 TetR family transcriptional regulator [Rhodospirillaceae bacterium]
MSPEGQAPAAHTKATRQDWIDLALKTLISDGVEQVKILPLSQSLKVSRSSFYWYFQSREDLLAALLEIWAGTNTPAIVSRAQRPCPNITDAVLAVFECFLDSTLFDPKLDFAVREWSRRDPEIRRIVDQSDDTRMQALTKMFARHGFAPNESFIRARILYYMQIGYYALDIAETLDERLAHSRDYLIGFTGEIPSQETLDRFISFAKSNTHPTS